MKLNYINLPRIYEYVYQKTKISAVPETGETVKSITVEVLDYNYGIKIEDDSTIVGEYKDAFDTDPNLIGVINKINPFAILYYNKWESLPDKKDNNIFIWRAPKKLERYFLYQVTVEYIIETTTTNSDGTSSSTFTKSIYEEILSQTVLGTWDRWAKKLRDYTNG